MTHTAVVKADRLDELAEKLARLTPRARIGLLLRLGVPADDVMGVTACTDHTGWRPLPSDASLRFDGTVVWCKGCFRWYQC